MKLIFLVLLCIGFNTSAKAMTCNVAGTSCNNVVVTSVWVRTNGTVLLAVDGDIPTSCNYGKFELLLKDEPGTSADNRAFSALLTFISQHKKITMRMIPTEVGLRGTDINTGCSALSPATVTSIIATFDTADYGPDVVIPVADDIP